MSLNVSNLIARDLMSKKIAMINGEATVADAIKKMRDEKVTSLFVNRRNKSDAWGVITVRDVVHKIIATDLDPKVVKVFEVMSKPVVTLSPGLGVRYCARLMKNLGIRRLPVLDGDELVGVVSHSDLFRALEF